MAHLAPLLYSHSENACFRLYLPWPTNTISNLRKVDGNDPVKPNIHPEYGEITATCSCGNVIHTRSTLKKDIHLEVCSKCHPFYTGKQKIVDTGGRVERFQKRFGTQYKIGT